MRFSILLLTTTTLLGAAACTQVEPSGPAEGTTEAVAAAPATPAVETAAVPAVAQDTLPQLTGSYWEARKTLLSQGYTPVNLVSEGHRVCVAEMEQGREISGPCPSHEEVLPEIQDCAGTGLGPCRAIWHSPAGRNVTILTVDGPQPGVISTIEWSTGGDAQGTGQD